MTRRRLSPAPLQVLLNNRLVGHLRKGTNWAVSFHYDQGWLSWEYALPISLSLPLREDAYRGARVVAVFENLLPDLQTLRLRVAERVGADGTDAYSLLAAIGRDCVGAWQFLDVDEDISGSDTSKISGETVDEATIEQLLKGLVHAPLGLSRDDTFRISLAGAQEKTALLRYRGKWLKPHGITPTTHILKKAIGQLPNGLDLSNSVENEYYCLKLAAAFGLSVNSAEIVTFGKTKTLVVKRFDRRWTKDKRLLRLPQEDCCQALSVPPTRKYQSDGGPGLLDVLELLKGSDDPARDQKTVLKAQIFFWLIGATDGHAKNFSVFLGPGMSYRSTPLYDVLTAEPSFQAKQIQRKQMKLAMSVGDHRHYRLDQIHGRHFVQTGKKAGVPTVLVEEAIMEIADGAEAALQTVEHLLPKGFPAAVPEAVRKAVMVRVSRLRI